MQRLLRPTILSLGLTVPTASMALGLGDIRVDSALHQPLVAQIELVGAGDDELGRLTAAIASDDLFQRYNLERAPFIYGTTLSVGRDAQGRPVLNMRSTEKFTEPVVTLLVDLHTPHGELVREYTLFLDPAGLVDNGGALANAGAASNTDAASKNAAFSEAGAATGSAIPKSLGLTYTVSRRDTLDRIVTAAGARSRIERHRMMIAIFRNNPAAFRNNFNRMHAGVTLTFPTAEQLAAISVEQTNREYDAQMAAWHSSRSASTSTQPASRSTSDTSTGSSASGSTGSSVAGQTAKVVDGDRREGSDAAKAAAASIASSAGMGSGKAAKAGNAAETMPTDPAALKQRIASLEQSLAQTQQQLKEPLPALSSSPAPITSVAHHTAPTSTRAAAMAGSAATATEGSTVASAVRAAMNAASASTASTSPTLAAQQASAANTGSPLATLSAPAPITHAAAAVIASAADTASTDEATSEDEEETPAPRNHLVQLIAAGISAAALFFAGAWFFLRRRNAYIHSGPKHGTADANSILSHDEVAESPDTVDFIASTVSVARLPAAANSPVIANAPAAAEKARSEPKAARTDAERAQTNAKQDTNNESSWFEDSFSTPIADLLNDPTVSLAIDETVALPADLAEPTVKLPASTGGETMDTEVLVAPDLQVAGDTVEQKFGFFNPEATQNTEHVVMGSALNEPKSFVERRKNPAEVLRQAIEREPDRSDLRLKLLELYYTAAAENRRAFLEATRQLTKSENLATPEDWSRIADMGRIIAPDDELFSSEGEADDKRVA
jgi:FimV-like protein